MKEMKRATIKWKGLLFAACILFSLVLVGKVQASAATLTMTIERFSIGGGFIEEPMIVNFTPGETYADVLQRVLREKGYSYSAQTGDNFYLQGIDNVDTGIGNMPACVKNILDDRKTAIIGNEMHPGGLYEFSYTGGSGWMYYVNNQYVDGMSRVKPVQGDVTRFMFTLYYSTDLTGELKSPGGDVVEKVYYRPADKTELVRLMGIVNQERSRWAAVDGFTEAYAEACTVMAKMDATGNDVSQALSWLREIQKELPTTVPASFSITDSVLKLQAGGGSATLNVSMLPSYDSNAVSWTSSNTSVATVKKGVVTPKGIGTATITGKTYNGLSDTCQVTVTKEPIPATGVMVSPTLLKLTTKSKAVTLTYAVTPLGADIDNVRWESDNTSVATVDSAGKVTPAGSGMANISCKVGSFSAACKVTVYPAAESIALSQTSLSMWAGGETATLTCVYTPANSYADVTWTTDNKSVVTVDENGTVAPVAIGETTIYAKTDDGKSASCKVKVQASQKPEFVSGKPVVTAKATSATTVSVQWKEYKNADRYIVSRRAVGSGPLTEIASVTGLSYTDKTAKAGTTYYYTVKAVSKKWGAEAFSKYDTNIQVTTPKAALSVGKASISSVSSAGYNKIKITWKKVTNATGYIVYRSTSANGSYKAIKTITSGKTVSYTNSGLTAGKAYYYKVRAFAESGSKKVNGAASTAKGAKPVPAKPSLKVSAGSRKAALKWSKVSGASGYTVVYSTSKNSGYKTLKTITKGSTVSYTKTGLQKGRTYYYRVRAYRTVSGKKIYGAYSDVKSVKVK